MKVAVLFSGYLRTYKKCYENIKKKILDKYDCDVFASIYIDDPNFNILQFNEMYNPKLVNIHVFEKLDFIYPDFEVNMGLTTFVSDYKSRNKNISYENGVFFDDNIKRYKVFLNNRTVLSQFFKIYDTMNLCEKYSNEKNIKYDYVIRIRFDLKIDGEFGLLDIDEKTIYTNEIKNHFENISVCDFFFYGKYETMKTFLKLYDNLNNVCKYINDNNWYIPIHSHQETIYFVHGFINGFKFVDNNKLGKYNYLTYIVRN